MDITLHSSGLDDLSPKVYRSPGIHGSTLIDRLCLKYGHYQRDKNGLPISDRNRELGNVFEHVTCERFARAHPGEVFVHNPEILCDGIYLTPDLVWVSGFADVEIKWTWMSPANGPDDLKMWKYLVQGEAYLYALRKVIAGEATIRDACEYESDVEWKGQDYLINYCLSSLDGFPPHDAFTTLYLTVGFANDFRPQADQIPCWKIKFWPEELAMNWAMLMDEKRRLEEEEREGRDEEHEAEKWERSI